MSDKLKLACAPEIANCFVEKDSIIHVTLRLYICFIFQEGHWSNVENINFFNPISPLPGHCKMAKLFHQVRTDNIDVLLNVA